LAALAERATFISSAVIGAPRL